MSVKIRNVLLLDNVDPSAKNILEENGISATLCKEKMTEEQLIRTLQDYDGMVVRSATKVTSAIVENCPNLKIIGRAGVGVDNIDIKSATKNGIIVMNTPSGNTISAAEHTCTLICCLSRNVPAADASMKSEKWDRKAFMGHELLGKTLGVIGLGRIGREAAIRMQSFGMTTIGFDPYVSKEDAAKFNIEWMSLGGIWMKADYITVHTPLMPQTKGLLNDDTFAKCKKGVRVINCARGGIIDEDALLRALESGRCGGAGLDVFVDEPATNFALIKHPKVVACPHLGASTKEGQARCGREIAQQIADVSNGKSYFGVINAPAFSHSQGLSPWLSAVNNLGKIIKSFAGKTNPTLIKINLSGEKLANPNALSSLKAAVGAGLLSNDAKVNLVNACDAISEQKVLVAVSSENGVVGNFTRFCTVEAEFESSTIRLDTTLLDDQGVLLAIDSEVFSIPLPLKGNMILCKNTNGLTKVLDVISKCGASVYSLSSTSGPGEQWVAAITSDNQPQVDGFVSVKF